jgi:microcystin-dependent protein
MTTSQQSRLGSAPEEGMKAPVVTISSGQETLFGIGQSIAGVVIGDMDRVAINAQTDPTENGIYNARGGKDWERANDMNGPDDVENGQLLSDGNTSAVYSIIAPDPWVPGTDVVNFGLLLSPVGFFWGAITGTLSNQADLQLELDAKSDTGHGHVEADIGDLQDYLLDAAGSIAIDGEFYARQDAGWSVIDFSVFSPAGHVHVEADITNLQAYLIDAAGSIANDNQLWARANGAWQAFSTSSGTTGEIIAWPDADVPQNFLDCDGQSYNAVTFADLFAVLGYKYGGSGANFNVPDLRGTFIRGTANGSGQDPDRLARTDRGDGATGDLVGTKQTDEFKLHGHTVPLKIIGSSEGGGGDAEVRAQNTATSQTGGSETRPRNIYMNYIIRYTGGGSGITQPPSIEVQDTGVPVTTAVQLLNFIGFNITQPLTDQVDISYGPSQVAGQYCPGYAFTYVSDSVFDISGTDASLLFNNRRVRFIDGAANYYGTVANSVYSAPDTTITMNMEDGEILTPTISEFCLVTGAAAWSAISEAPFGNNPIHDIKTGRIGATEWWFICGNDGALMYSTNAGLNWTAVTQTPTALNFYVLVYDSVNEEFHVGGESGVIGKTSDGVNWSLDTTSIPALLIGGGPGHIHGFAHMVTTDWLAVFAEDTVGIYVGFNSTDFGATWVRRAVSSTAIGGNGNKGMNAHWSGSASFGWGYKRPGNTAIYGVTGEADTGVSSIQSFGTAALVAIFEFLDPSTGQAANVAGKANNDIDGGSGWNAVDSLTFSNNMNDFAYLDVHDRIVGVGVLGQIGYWNRVDKAVNQTWHSVTNGFDPLADILAVDANNTDGMYVAVADNGQICRSTNGLGDPTGPTPTEAGFTLIAADPFGGAPITHIMAGAIGAQVYWVACGGSLMFRSTDAGVTWSAITHGCSDSVVSLHYSPEVEAFVAGFESGDFAYTIDGGLVWVADTTTVAAIGLPGGLSVQGLYFFRDTGNWLFFFPAGAATTTYTVLDITAPVFVVQDASVTAIQPDVPVSGPASNTNVAWQDTSNIVPYFTGGSDFTSSSLGTITLNPVPRTAFKYNDGTLSHSRDIFVGNSNGDITYQFGSPATVNVMPGAVRGFALASVSGRYVAVGDQSQIWTLASPDLDGGNWIEVINPFTANILAVWYDPSDDIIIAVGSNGEIGRSVDGIS